MSITGNIFPRPAILCSIFLCALFLFLLCGEALAQSNPPPQNPPPPPATGTTCTKQAFYDELDGGGADLLNAVMSTVSGVLESSSRGLYNNIIRDNGYMRAISGLLTLYVAIYGVMIMFQMVPAAGGEVVMRLVKIGIIIALTSPTGWDFFSQHVRSLFVDGMNELIVILNNITLGRNDPIPPPGSAVAATVVLISPVKLLLSSQLYITLLAAAFTGPYGFVYAILIIWAICTLAYTVVAILSTYIKALVGLYFLFALAPIFFLFMLFQYTRHIFDGWLNMVISFVLQPLFIFVFIGLFMELIIATAGSVLKVPVCYTKIKLIDMADISFNMWRFKIPKAVIDPNIQTPVLSPSHYEMYEGGWGFCGPTIFCGTSSGCESCIYPIFPIDIMDVLLLIIVTQMAFNYTKFVTQIASEVAGASTSVSTHAESVRRWFLGAGITPGQLAGGAARTGGRAAVAGGRAVTATGRGVKNLGSKMRGGGPKG